MIVFDYWMDVNNYRMFSSLNCFILQKERLWLDPMNNQNVYLDYWIAYGIFIDYILLLVLYVVMRLVSHELFHTHTHTQTHTHTSTCIDMCCLFCFMLCYVMLCYVISMYIYISLRLLIFRCVHVSLVIGIRWVFQVNVSHPRCISWSTICLSLRRFITQWVCLVSKQQKLFTQCSISWIGNMHTWDWCKAYRSNYKSLHSFAWSSCAWFCSSSS